ncbi:hypothetical protein M378DRAFT_465405 [Amanita muscaria Koide BX008]|uniref:Uncharacterized protein n=1 Tax=Amanita muscaria (strain Koide BX008) TaxID=946122 RepID=A0A0C2W636_AMAMK|nr:hypothetical protein M378DRAFT_465405 [Amanita muscaria Koide BX008]
MIDDQSDHRPKYFASIVETSSRHNCRRTAQCSGRSSLMEISWEDHRLRGGSLGNRVSCESLRKKPPITLDIDTLPSSLDFSPALVAPSLLTLTDLSPPRPFDVKLQIESPGAIGNPAIIRTYISLPLPIFSLIYLPSDCLSIL